MTKTATDIDKLPFEDALAELERVVRALEEGEGGLQQAVDLYERGAKLRKRCEDELRAAQARIEAVAASADGEAIGTKPLDAE
ncbi:MAG: exodeoxyribonuclease VII small subunit [Pseudomonadota bacterium]